MALAPVVEEVSTRFSLSAMFPLNTEETVCVVPPPEVPAPAPLVGHDNNVAANGLVAAGEQGQR